MLHDAYAYSYIIGMLYFVTNVQLLEQFLKLFLSLLKYIHRYPMTHIIIEVITSQ